jgi:hypothetical protein
MHMGPAEVRRSRESIHPGKARVGETALDRSEVVGCWGHAELKWGVVESLGRLGWRERSGGATGNDLQHRESAQGIESLGETRRRLHRQPWKAGFW